MPTATYVALANTTLGSPAASVTFSSIPNTYRDLVIHVNGGITDDDRFGLLQFNSDANGNYTNIFIANLSSQVRSSVSGAEFMYGTGQMAGTINIMDYSITNKHKTMIVRNAAGVALVYMYADTWANTNAINSIKFLTTTTGFSPSSTFTAGTTFAIYGIVG